MSDPSAPTLPALEPERLASLRRRAASRLSGVAAARGASAGAADALSVLHAMASSPQTAPDALALLHELQVHQVELELQAQELRESRAELESAWRRQTELHDYQPVGACTVDARRVLVELNRSGADLLGIARDDAPGLSFDDVLDAEGARRFAAALARLDAGATRATCPLMLQPKKGARGPVLATIGKDPAGHRYLVNLTVVDDRQER